MAVDAKIGKPVEDRPPAAKRRSYYHIYLNSKTQGKIDVTEYEKLWREQNGVCAICGQPETAANSSRLAIDHCHKTGRVRGLLCSACNRALGLFRDSEELLENAIEYLRQQRSEEVQLLPVERVKRPAMLQDGEEVYYTTEEACAYLGVSPGVLQRLKKDGFIRRYRQGLTPTIYYSKSELDEVRRLEMETASNGSTRPTAMQVEEEVYYSTDEVCNYLGISRETVNAMVRDGRLHRYRQGLARTSYYRLSELDALKMMRLVDNRE